MELRLMDRTGKESGKVKLPVQFDEEPRQDLIKRAVDSIQANRRQPYGALPTAGKRASAKLPRRRRNYKTAYGRGISRVPRKIMSRRGGRMNWRGAFAPGMVGGRRAHPPKAEKSFKKSINDKERQKAIRSALAFTLSKDAVTKRGHLAPDHYPFALAKDAEAIDKTKEAVRLLVALGLEKELVRAEVKKVRPGKGKMRGRRYRKKTSVLIVTSQSCPLTKAARNIAGVDAVAVHQLNAEILAPGGAPGRLTLFTQGAIERLAKEKLFGEAQ
ncbi:MAG: 50S ribosomal protein L4 [Nanoarchaeota archaeon]